MADPNALIRLTIAGKRRLTSDIWEITLEPADGSALQPFEPGAHIGVETPSGAMRQYSLVNDGRAPTRYVIALKREPESRGGSRSMVEDTAIGGTLRADAPANSFPLAEAPGYLLIAGGIGIAPILAMANRLDEEGRPFRLIYCTRSAAESAYLEEMQRPLRRPADAASRRWRPGRLLRFLGRFRRTDGHPGLLLRPEAADGGSQGGLRPLARGAGAVRGFQPVEAVRPDDRPFEVVLQRSGRTVAVPADLPILEALRAAGIAAPSSCESGVCGTCKTRLIAGEADHRDMVLQDEERAAYIMLCVSRARSGALTLDL